MGSFTFTNPRVRTYHYIITLECGAELEANSPAVLGSALTCGHTGNHLTSPVVSCTPERNK